MIRARGIINATSGMMKDITITDKITLNGDLDITTAGFEIKSDEVIEKIYANMSGRDFLNSIRSDFSFPSGMTSFSVSYGFTASFGGRVFDTITFDNNYYHTLYRNGQQISQPILGLGTASITIRMGSNRKIMIYDAPDGLPKHVNGVYRESDGRGGWTLKVRG